MAENLCSFIFCLYLCLHLLLLPAEHFVVRKPDFTHQVNQRQKTLLHRGKEKGLVAKVTSLNKAVDLPEKHYNIQCLNWQKDSTLKVKLFTKRCSVSLEVLSNWTLNTKCKQSAAENKHQTIPKKIKTAKRKAPVYNDNPYVRIVGELMQKVKRIKNGTVLRKHKFPKYCRLCKCVFYGDGLYTDCSGRWLNQLFDKFDNATVMLNTSNNRIETVTDTVFQGLPNMRLLDLSYNRINDIDLNSFEEMPNLEILLLHGNDFYLPQLVIQEGVFSGLYSVRLLTLHLNVDVDLVNHSCLQGEAFKELRSLEALYVDGYLNMSFDTNFLNTNLTHLSTSGKIGICGIFHLNNETFQGIPKLVSLNIESCLIVFIASMVFAPLKNLQILNITNNQGLDVDSINKAVASVTDNNSLEVLDMRMIFSWMEGGCKLTEKNMANINALPLKELYMDFNSINFIDYETFAQGLINLKLLSLRGNGLYIGLFFFVLINCHPKLEILDVGNQFGPPSSSHKRLHTSIERPSGKELLTSAKEKEKNMSQTLTKYKNTEPNKVNLNTLIVTSVPFINNCIDFDGTVTDLRYIDYSNNRMPELCLNCFINMGHLEFLNLSNSLIQNIKEDIFRDLNSLKVLDLSNNPLLDIFVYSQTLKFSLLANLEHLSLARNRIFLLKSSMLKGCHNLRFLDISENYLTNFDLDIKRMKNLSFIDLAKNRIQGLEESVRKSLDNIAEHSDLEIDLSENKLACSCENTEFLKWIYESKVKFRKRDKYICYFANGTTASLKSNVIQNLQAECFPYLPVIVVCTVLISCFIVSISAKIAYRYRWSILYLYYMYKVRSNLGNRQESFSNDNFEWDAFPSYDDAEATFVGRQMREHLENERGLKLHIRHRDFPLAEVNAVNISNAVKLSRRTILMLSKKFFQNKWCNFELNMARMEGIFTNRSVIIVVFLEEIAAELISYQVTDLLRECRVLDLPSDETLMEAFWSQLAKCITDD